MNKLLSFIFGLLIGFVVGLIVIMCLQSDLQLVKNKEIIDAGCGYYNSDKEFVFKDECKKYYQEVK